MAALRVHAVSRSRTNHCSGAIIDKEVASALMLL